MADKKSFIERIKEHTRSDDWLQRLVGSAPRYGVRYNEVITLLSLYGGQRFFDAIQVPRDEDPPKDIVQAAREALTVDYLSGFTELSTFLRGDDYQDHLSNMAEALSQLYDQLEAGNSKMYHRIPSRNAMTGRIVNHGSICVSYCEMSSSEFDDLLTQILVRTIERINYFFNGFDYSTYDKIEDYLSECEHNQKFIAEKLNNHSEQISKFIDLFIRHHELATTLFRDNFYFENQVRDIYHHESINEYLTQAACIENLIPFQDHCNDVIKDAMTRFYDYTNGLIQNFAHNGHGTFSQSLAEIAFLNNNTAKTPDLNKFLNRIQANRTVKNLIAKKFKTLDFMYGYKSYDQMACMILSERTISSIIHHISEHQRVSGDVYFSPKLLAVASGMPRDPLAWDEYIYSYPKNREEFAAIEKVADELSNQAIITLAIKVIKLVDRDLLSDKVLSQAIYRIFEVYPSLDVRRGPGRRSLRETVKILIEKSIRGNTIDG